VLNKNKRAGKTFVLIDGQVVAGPFATAAEVVKTREALELPIPERGARHATGDVIEFLTGVERGRRLPEDIRPARLALQMFG
jgi:hypothetical protein